MTRLPLRLGARAATLALAACACWVAVAAPPPDSTQFPYAGFQASCAPWDGPAIVIAISRSPVECGEHRVYELNVSLWKDLPPHAGQTISLGSASNKGHASYCAGAGKQCEIAATGTVQFELFKSGKLAQGTYDFTFPKAGRLKGGFRAQWCASRVFCG
jgi:hypothetical protein